MKFIDKLKRGRDILEARVKSAKAQINLAETLQALDFTAAGIKELIEFASVDPDDLLVQVQMEFANSPDEIENLSNELHQLFDLVHQYGEEFWEAEEEINRLKRKDK